MFFFREPISIRMEYEQHIQLRFALEYMEVSFDDLVNVLLVQFVQIYEQFGEQFFLEKLEEISEAWANEGRKWRGTTKHYNHKKIHLLKLMIQKSNVRDVSEVAEFLVNDFLETFAKCPEDSKKIIRKEYEYRLAR